MKRALYTIAFVCLFASVAHAQGSYFGDIAPSTIIDVKFASWDWAAGTPTTLAGTPAVKCYKDNSTTESASGITLSVDFDSVTGMNNLRVDTSSDGTFYAAGSNFSCVLTAGTVSGLSWVGRPIVHFSINDRSALRPTTAGRTLVVDASGLADANTVKVGPTGSGTAQTAGDIIATQGTTNNRIGAFTGSGVNTILGFLKAMARKDLSAPSDVGGTFDPSTDSLEAATDAAVTLTAQGATNFNTFFDNSSSSSTAVVGSIDTTISSRFGLIRASTAQAGAASTITLDASASGTDDFYNNTIIVLTGSTGVGQVRRIRDYVGATKVATITPNWTTNPSGTSTFAIFPATSGWDEVLADHATAGSTGAGLSSASSAGDPWSTTLPGAYGGGTAGNIVGNNLNAAVSAVKAKTDSLTFTISGKVDATPYGAITLQKNVAFNNFPIWMLSSAGAGVTGISPACTIQKDAGVFAATTNSAVEIGSGKYRLNLTATETNANIISIICTGTGAVTYRTNVTPQQ